jgi:hypothetical protein
MRPFVKVVADSKAWWPAGKLKTLAEKNEDNRRKNKQ